MEEKGRIWRNVIVMYQHLHFYFLYPFAELNYLFLCKISQTQSSGFSIVSVIIPNFFFENKQCVLESGNEVLFGVSVELMDAFVGLGFVFPLFLFCIVLVLKLIIWCIVYMINDCLSVSTVSKSCLNLYFASSLHSVI